MDCDDVGESPIDEDVKNDTRWKAGESANPNGRPKGKQNSKPRSKMRSTLSKLYAIEAEAVELIRQQMTGKDKNGKPVDAPSKDKVDMAKFVVKTIESLNNTCLREEALILGIREKGNEQGAKDLEDNQSTKAEELPTFSLDMDSETKH